MATILVLGGLGAGCASRPHWQPVEAEGGLVNGWTCRRPPEQWPDTGYQYYRLKYYLPEMDAAINRHQRVSDQGVVIPFVSDLSRNSTP